MTEKLYPCPFDNDVPCNMKMCEYCFGGMLPKKYIDIEEVSIVTITGTGSKVCEHVGFYHTVNFLCFKKRFLACEKCGALIPQRGWRFNI